MQLAGVREDIVGSLSVVLGAEKAEHYVANLEQLVEERALIGAQKGATPIVVKGILATAAVNVVFLLLHRRRRRAEMAGLEGMRRGSRRRNRRR